MPAAAEVDKDRADREPPTPHPVMCVISIEYSHRQIMTTIRSNPSIHTYGPSRLSRLGPSDY